MDTDPTDVDGGTPLSDRELEHVRRVLRDDDRATWARKKLGFILPIVVAVVTALWQVYEWAAKHLKVTP
jgi:hypothetical protein